MDMSSAEYSAYVAEKAKPSPIRKNITWAFFVGGMICALGQGFMDVYQYFGMGNTLASTATSMTLIGIASLLTGAGVFDNLAKRAGAGTLVPITGFANAMAAPAMEFRSEGVVAGTTAKLFIVAGPVLVFGICASIVQGIIQYGIQQL